MNSKQNNKSQDQNTEKLKEIPKWTRKYAQNRTLTIFVYLLIASFICIPIAFSLSFLLVAFQKGNMIVAGIGIVMLVASFVFLYIFKKSNYKIFRWIDQRIYDDEGTASILKPELTKRKKWVELAASIVFLILFMGIMYLGMENFIPVKYVQPVAALCYIPFAISRYLWRYPTMIGPIFLLTPILYAIHAILIVMGVPIFFKGQIGVILNMSLPLLGYDLLTHIISHIYSRYALKKLKGLTHLEGDEADGD